MKLQLLFLPISLFSFGFLLAQSPGSLDPAFGSIGYVTKDVSNEINTAKLVFLQPDGKIVSLGNSGNSFNLTSVGALRYTSDGALDTGFGAAGVFKEAGFGYPSTSIDYCELWSGVLQPDGKIVLAGIFQGFNLGTYIFVIRLNANGTKDPGFSNNGIFTTPVINYSEPRGRSVKIGLLQDNKIILFTGTKSSDKFSLLRINENGTADTSFGTNGWLDVASSLGPVFNMSANDLIVQPDGKILASGTALTTPSMSKGYVFRFFPDGSFDNSFSADGELLTASASAMVLLPDGKILLRGLSNISRFQSNGAIDNTFGSNGTVQLSLTFHTMTTQMDGKIILAGSDNNQGILIRRNVNGNSDQSFGNTGGGYTIIPGASVYYHVLQQPDGKLVACGRKDSDFLLGRHFAQTVSASEEIEIFQQFALGPNPTYGDIVLQFQLAEPQNLAISLFNVAGQCVHTVAKKAFFTAGEQQYPIQLTNLPVGTYFLQIKGDLSEKVCKIQFQKNE